MAVWLYYRRKLHLASLLIICSAALLTATLSLTRAPLLLWAITLLTSTSVFGSLTSQQVWRLACLLFLPIVLVTLSFGYANETLYQIIKTYVWGGAKAYESILNGQYTGYRLHENNTYSLDFLNYTAHKLGFISSYPSLVREYANGPIYTNVYTYLDAFTLDFGIFGALLCAFLLGWLAAFLHRKAYQSQSITIVTYYAFVNYAIAISFMNHELIRINAFLLAGEVWLIHKLITPTNP